MNPFEIAIMGSILGTAIATCIYIYLFKVYRERYLGFWILSWLCYFIRLVFLDRAAIFSENVNNISVNTGLGFLIITTLNVSLLTWGIFDFLGEKLRSWVAHMALIVSVLGAVIISFNPVFEVKALLPCLYFASMYIWTGLVLLRKVDTGGLGVWLTGISLIFLGVHGLDFIFLRPVQWFVPLGYPIDALLRFLIALGMLIVYLEKTRTDLVHSRDCYRLLAENAVDIIYRYALSPEPGFTYISPSIADVTGYRAEEFYTDGSLFLKIVHTRDRKKLAAFLRAPVAGKAPLTFCIITKAQKEVWLEQTSVPVNDMEGNLVTIEGVIRDITMRRKLEQDMARLDSLNTVGEMAANLAHEIRNPMTTVRGYLQMLSQNPELARYDERFGIMIEELDRANAIISEYLSLCKNKVVELKAGFLDKIVLALYPLLQADAHGSNSQVKLDLQAVPEAFLDEKEIRQLMLNLVRNGLEAMPAGGLLTISTFVENNNVVLAVRDEGGGIPPHVLENLGTPFLTTKETGTGLGLAVCYRIANRHQAEIKVDTGGAGTTFRVYFPQIMSF